MGHDGTPGQAERLGSWVAASNQGERVYLEPGDRLLILLPAESDAVWVNPGDYLVRDRRRPAWWRSYGAAAFSDNFAAQVRELPIFDSGEVA